MKTNQELHAAAIDLLNLIKEAEAKKDLIWKRYRDWLPYQTQQDLEKFEHRTDIMDRTISRLTESYKRVIQQIIIDL